MQTETTIAEDDRNGGLHINITSSGTGSLSLEIYCPANDATATITIFTDNKSGLLELLRNATDECLLRVRDEEQKGERDDA